MTFQEAVNQIAEICKEVGIKEYSVAVGAYAHGHERMPKVSITFSAYSGCDIMKTIRATSLESLVNSCRDYATELSQPADAQFELGASDA